jgi:hypothetical protein
MKLKEKVCIGIGKFSVCNRLINSKCTTLNQECEQGWIYYNGCCYLYNSVP